VKKAVDNNLPSWQYEDITRRASGIKGSRKRSCVSRRDHGRLATYVYRRRSSSLCSSSSLSSFSSTSPRRFATKPVRENKLVHVIYNTIYYLQTALICDRNEEVTVRRHDDVELSPRRMSDRSAW